jgi:hypothetical protein
VQSFLAAPVIALLYVFGTSAILAFVPAGKIDVIGPVAQAANCIRRLAACPRGRAARNSLPADELSCQLQRLHPRFRTPVNSILFLGGITLAVGAAVLSGVGNQELFEMLQIWDSLFMPWRTSRSSPSPC